MPIGSDIENMQITKI